MGILKDHVEDSPNKLFVGGIPHDYNEDMVKTILMRYGRLKAFHMPKDNGKSKGFAFCEYIDANSTN